MAKLAPETVLEILVQIPDTENARVHDDLAEAALTMPAKVAASIVPNAISWIRSPFKLLLPEKLGALISRLAVGGEVKSALKLAKALLAIRAGPRMSQQVTEENRFRFPKPQPFFDLWHCGQILEKNIPDLVAAAGDKTLKLLCDLLDAAVRMSQRSDEGQGPDDLSYIWRSAIDQPQYSVESDVRGFLVSAVLDAAEQTAQCNRAKVPEIVRYLENRTWRVFHRIALHILRLFPDTAPDLVRDRLTEPEQFDSTDYRREYNLLAKECFVRLKPEEQNKILDWIQKGPDVELYKAGWEKFYGTPPTDEKISGYSKTWQRDRLAPISAGLPQDWKQRYAQLVAEFGPLRSRKPVAVQCGGGRAR